MPKISSKIRQAKLSRMLEDKMNKAHLKEGKVSRTSYNFRRKAKGGNLSQIASIF